MLVQEKAKAPSGAFSCLSDMFHKHHPTPSLLSGYEREIARATFANLASAIVYNQDDVSSALSLLVISGRMAAMPQERVTSFEVLFDNCLDDAVKSVIGGDELCCSQLVDTVSVFPGFREDWPKGQTLMRPMWLLPQRPQPAFMGSLHHLLEGAEG